MFALPFTEAEIVVEVNVDTGFAEMLNVALAAPAGTVIDAGTLADALLLDNEIVVPPVGAGATKNTGS